jgi:hypothetical protein
VSQAGGANDSQPGLRAGEFKEEDRKGMLKRRGRKDGPDEQEKGAELGARVASVTPSSGCSKSCLILL